MEYFCEIYLFKSYSGFYVLSLVDTSYVTSTPPNNILSSVQSNLLRLFGACLLISIELVASIRVGLSQLKVCLLPKGFLQTQSTCLQTKQNHPRTNSHLAQLMQLPTQTIDGPIGPNTNHLEKNKQNDLNINKTIAYATFIVNYILINPKRHQAQKK